MNKKSFTVLVCAAVAVLSACTKPVSENTSNVVVTDSVTEDDKIGASSLHPNSITDYDRAAITSLINMDLKEHLGKDGFATVYQDEVEFTKEHGILTAQGNYICYTEGYEVLGFSYKYEDCLEHYKLLSYDISKDAQQLVNTTPTSPRREPDKSYDITIAYSLTVTFSHDGPGDCRIILVDDNGEIVEEILNQSGVVDTVKTVVVPAGHYKMEFYVDGAWSMSYSTAES